MTTISTFRVLLCERAHAVQAEYVDVPGLFATEQMLKGESHPRLQVARELVPAFRRSRRPFRCSRIFICSRWFDVKAFGASHVEPAASFAHSSGRGGKLAVVADSYATFFLVFFPRPRRLLLPMLFAASGKLREQRRGARHRRTSPVIATKGRRPRTSRSSGSMRETPSKKESQAQKPASRPILPRKWKPREAGI